MGTEVEGVDVGPVLFEGGLECGVDAADILGGVKAESDAALVGDDDDALARLVEAGIVETYATLRTMGE